KYARYGLIPPAPPANPRVFNPPLPTQEIPQQSADRTDRAFLNELAQLYGFLFYVTPGPAPLSSRVHWGPPKRLSIPQRALSVNMGPVSNIESINFRYDGLHAQRVTYTSQGRSQTVTSPSLARSIPLARDRAEARRLTHLIDDDPQRAEVRAQG